MEKLQTLPLLAQGDVFSAAAKLGGQVWSVFKRGRFVPRDSQEVKQEVVCVPQWKVKGHLLMNRVKILPSSAASTRPSGDELT